MTGRMARSLVAARDGQVAVTRRRVRAYIGLGANVGDAAATLAEAVAALAALPGTRLRGVSRLYVTAPVGVTDQPDFHNAVVALDVPAGPDPATGALALLAALKDARARVRPPARGGAGARASSISTCSSSGGRALAIERPPDARSIDAETDPAKAAKLLEVPHAGGATAPVRARAAGRPRAAASCRRAGARRSRPPAAGRSGSKAPDAVRADRGLGSERRRRAGARLQPR